MKSLDEWITQQARKIFFLYKLTVQKHLGVLLRKHCKEGASVVTHFLAPRARDGVYLF
jgi:hypothetical protein